MSTAGVGSTVCLQLSFTVSPLSVILTSVCFKLSEWPLTSVCFKFFEMALDECLLQVM